MRRVLVVTFDRRWFARFSAALSQAGNFYRPVCVTTLMEAFNKTEEAAPDLVIVAEEFTRLPEFEMMLALFAMLNLNWLELTNRALLQDTSDAKSATSGVFAIDVRDDMPGTVTQVAAMATKSPRLAMAQNSTLPDLREKTANRLVLLGSSTGGVEALSLILRQYPKTCPPTLIVQHTGQNFGTGLVQLLDRLSPARVVQARNGLDVSQGMVCIAAGGTAHLTIAANSAYRMRMIEGQRISGHRPSVDALFHSAVPVAKSCIAGLLTGMGKDGAEGLLALRKAGAATFCQDEATSVVYGMPRAAWESGAAERQVPIQKVTGHIIKSSRQRERA